MLKFLAATIVGSAVVLSATDAFAGHGCRQGGGGVYYAPAPVAVAPAAPQGTQAAAPQGVRTYSYQPVQTVQPVYRSYSRPMRGGRSTVRAYENGAFKSLGIGY